MALPAANPHDIDNLLAGYRAARAQQALFDPRGGAVTGYDEFVDAAGNVRPSWVELAECVGERGRGGLEQLRSVMRSPVDNDGITYIQLDTNGDAVTNGDGTAVPGPWHLDASAAADLGDRLGHPGIRSGAALPTARCGAGRPVRPAPLGDRRRVARATALRASRLCPGRARDRGAGQASAIHARVRHQPWRRRCVSGQRRLDAGAVGRRLCPGRPARGRARHPRPLRADRAPARLAMGPGAEAGTDRRGARIRRGAGGRGAEPRHPLRDRVRPGLPGQRAGLSDGGERGPGGARRQAVDAIAGHPQAGGRGAAAGGRRLHRSAGSARRLAAGRGGAGRGAAQGSGDRRQHARQRDPGKPWAASLSARAGRIAARARRRCWRPHRCIGAASMSSVRTC